MTVLVIAEHDNATLKGATLNTVTAALACGGDVHVLVAGHNAGAAAAAAAHIAGVAKVLHADAAALADGLAENVAAQVLALAPSYDMLPMMLRPASTGEVVPRTLELVPPLPEQHALWSEAARMAQDFWWRVEVHAGISADMSRIAGEQARKLQTAISRFG